MRRLNAIVTGMILALFLIHMIWGSLELAGMTSGGNDIFLSLSYLMTGLVVLHVIFSLKMTLDTLKAQREAGVSYPGANRLFWVRRISGIALMIFMALHVMMFRGIQTEEGFRLRLFHGAGLAAMLCMVVSLMIHLLTNIRPLKIALGLEDRKDFRVEILLVLSILLLLSAVAFVIYYLRWHRV